MNNQEYIQRHRDEDVRVLALKPVPEGVDLKWCLQQIEGWQTARHKLPRWADIAGLWFPPHLSLEQCSSEDTAKYKSQLAGRLLPSPDLRSSMIDLTGGYGVDFSYMAPAFQHAVYVEQQPHLCDIAKCNFPLLGLTNATIINEETSPGSPFMQEQYSLIYLDPSRRNTAGKKMVAIEDCTPNLAALQEILLEHSRYVVIKLSPMLDITQALRVLHQVCEIHIVSVRGECKELLFVLSASSHRPTFYCVNLQSDDSVFVSDMPEEPRVPVCTENIQHYLYEPNASILKANQQDALPGKYDIAKLHPQSHLFTSDTFYADFPGRVFETEDWSHFNKQELRLFLSGISQANLTVRNFPSTVAELRKKLKLKEGGDVYIFATTLHDGTHALIRCKKITRDKY